jgi:hypothetical protein
MAITTYAELLSAIQNYEEDSSTIVTDRDDEWVTLAEQRIHYGSGLPGSPFYSPPLRIRAMEQAFTIRIEANQDGGTSGGSADAQTLTMTAPTVALGLTISFTAGFTNTGAMTLQPTGGSAVAIRKGVNNDALEAADIVLGAHYTVYYDGTFYKLMPSAGGAPLPSRFLGFKTIYDDGDKNRPLDFFSAQSMAGMEGSNSSGTVRGYTIDGDCIRLVSLPDGTRFLRGTYYRRFAALSAELNELFRRNPGIYLYGALLEASLYLGDDANITKWHGNFMSACQGVANVDYLDRYGAGPLQQRVAGPVV